MEVIIGILATLGMPILIIILIIILSSIKQVNEYERGILFEFGKFKRVLNPGWNTYFSIIPKN